jgi:uncharacterized protein YdeI (YjbR/CyaY-like superfamily)
MLHLRKIQYLNMTERGVKTFCPLSREEWRAWLQEHHDKEKSVWLIFYKKEANVSAITWSEAVDEAICFGWIDSIVKPVDEGRYMRFFSLRKAKSVWSKINKEKVQKLTEEGLMTKAGSDMIETAKKNGSWAIFDDAEALVIPEDLGRALEKWPNARGYFDSWSRSDKKNALQWLVLAKRSETREKRISEIVERADQNLKPKVIQWTKKTASD